MARLKDKIETLVNQKRIDNLSNKTRILISQICDPRIEQQLELSQRIDEVYQKMQRLIELETNKKIQNIDRQLDNMNARFGIIQDENHKRI